jgi:uncharacterized protein (TIGR02172 family)
MIDISIEKPIAQGRTADVYAWDETRVLKLFHNWFGLESVEYEFKITRAVRASGIKTPAALELIQVEGRNGLLYERAKGETMLAMFQHRPNRVFQYARTLARLHADMHERVFDADVPQQHARLQNKINQADALPPPVKQSLVNALASMPKGDRVCHGDFHPDNILLTRHETTIIDWIDATRGNPVADVARTSIIVLGAIAGKQVSNPFLRVLVGLFHTVYLREYSRLHPEGRYEYRHWLPIVAGARLSEGIPEVEKWLVEQAGKV